MRYTREEAGEDGWTDWIEPVIEGYKLSCCDCGLVHDMDFRIEDGRVQFKVRRNNRSTGQVRRHMRQEAGGLMARYRKKPVEVEISEPWSPEAPIEGVEYPPPAFAMPVVKAAAADAGEYAGRCGWINTLEGGHVVKPGERIVTGVRGERYPIDPGIFEATYEPADADPSRHAAEARQERSREGA